jgi:hypothetical protein
MKLHKVLWMVLILLMITCTVNCSTESKTELNYKKIDWLIFNNFDEHDDEALITLLKESRDAIDEAEYEYLKHYIFRRSSEKKVIEQLKKAFDLGHKDAGYDLYNHLIMHDKAIAEKYLVEAAKRESVEAMFTVGVHYNDQFDRFLSEFSKKEMLEMLMNSALEGQTQAIGSIGKHAINSEELATAEALFWRVINYLVNQEGSNNRLVAEFENNEEWKDYCLKFNQFMEGNFDLLAESTETSERDKYLLLSRSILNCMH